MRNLLEEFYGDHGIRPPTILGVREHVFTGSVSSSAYFMSSQESSFTFFEDFLSSPHLQIHRGNISVLRIIDPSEGCQISALIMEDRKRKIWIVQCLLLLSIGCLSQLRASDDVKFYESFDEKFEGRWVVSEKEDYNCVWKHSKSEGHDDYGFLVSDKAKKHAIVKVLKEPVELKDEISLRSASRKDLSVEVLISNTSALKMLDGFPRILTMSHRTQLCLVLTNVEQPIMFPSF
ncbi:calnexin [Dorcoceras hygrometricum]|uniref:Calnexin n=1 Tax=Dorcoceras hygrometricum TaxID=472368 RepID=A0A2Z7C2L4_9LAMI|nr:calnexin [Dorcoceras hygrometricum]